MVIVDVETTGLDPNRHCIVSVGAVDFMNPANAFFYAECRIWDDAEVSEIALRTNGFSLEALFDAEKRTVRQIICDFGVWLGNVGSRTVAGENPAFDRDFLVAASRRTGIELGLGRRTVDVHALCYSHHLRRGIAPPLREGKSELSLDATLRYVGLSDEPKPHNALTGAKMEAEARSRLIYGRPLLGEFQEYAVPEYLSASG